ncbi:MAG: polysaccharide biosynthesis/export family protein [Rikenellaceae bacterium]
MRVSKLLTLLIVVVIAGVGCGVHKQVPYLQNSGSLTISPHDSTSRLYNALIMPNDLITITVSTSDPTVAVPFNLTIPTVASTSQNTLTSQPSLQRYLVDSEGRINFPIIGEIHIAGLTKTEAEELIIEKLKPYLKEKPIVNVRVTNYNISVLGEVTRPGIFTIESEKVTIFEALAMAGDMTIYGKRVDVKLIREHTNGDREIVELDITDPEILTSPYYYLQQNDVVYVTPNKSKSKTAGISSSTTIWFSVVSTAVSLATLLISILL